MISKKNWTMRAAFLMLALVLITSCFVGGTFAKYVTSGSGEDYARVAKFGVHVEASGDAFAKEYDAVNPQLEDYNGDLIAQSVISAEDDVVAPGTAKTNVVSISVTGTPEVAVTVEHVGKVEFNEHWVDKDGNYYCPLRITVGNETFYGMEFDSAEAFAAKIKEKIDSSTNYPANTNLTQDAVNKAPAISWAWDFAGTDGKQTDEKDTYLGDQAADNKAATIKITVSTTVTQID